MAIIHVRLPWEDHRVASFAARWLMATRLAATTFATATAPIRWTAYRAPRHLRAATFGLLGAFAMS